MEKLLDDNNQLIIISIIVPIYNMEKYIHLCVSSILKQSFKNFELILIDNMSEDNSYNICIEYSKIDKRIVVDKCVNRGVSNARNMGISIAKGEYIIFIDADDTINNDYLKNLYLNIKHNDLVICGINIQDESRNYIRSYSIPRNLKFSMNDKESCEKIELLDSKNILNSIFNKIYKKDLIKSNFDSRYTIGEDLDFNLKYMLECDNISVITNCLYNYYTTEGLSDEKKERYLGQHLTTIDHIFQNNIELYNNSKVKCMSSALKRIYTRNVIQCINEYAFFFFFKEQFKLFCKNVCCNETRKGLLSKVDLSFLYNLEYYIINKKKSSLLFVICIVIKKMKRFI